MIKGTFEIADEDVKVVIDGNNLYFTDSGGQITTIEGLRLDYSGVLKEHPDLKDDKEWRKKAMERLKEHIKKFTTEKEKLEYVRQELVKFGYDALFYQVAGFRERRFQ